ncbi:MAG: hypothetical protein IPJ77_11605 [Planctomycetes bacterium]|nr:hypothetical protein [Planctomycetota bacterium]
MLRHATLFLAPLALAAAANAQQMTLFGRTYLVQRFDYTAEIRFQHPDPNLPGVQVGLNEVEGAAWLGVGRFLLASSEMRDVGSYENMVLEATLDVDPAGVVTGLSYVRTMLVNDAVPPPTGLGDPFDLNPRGIAVNPTAFGPGAGGNAVVGDRTALLARGLDVASGTLTGTNLAVNPPNNDLEDLLWVPDVTGTDGTLWTIDQSASMRVEVFTSAGAASFGFPVGRTRDPLLTGEPKGLSWLGDGGTLPPALRGQGGVVLVALDDTGPALEAYRRDGAFLGLVSLVDPALDPGTGGALQTESLCFDAATGRLFLWQQGTSGLDNFVYVLSPDCNGNGTADSADLLAGTSVDVDLDGAPDECQAYLGGAFCAGDGLDPAVTTPCPCGNAGAAGRGCANSVVAAGGRLAVSGSTAVDPGTGTDTLVLQGSGMPATVACIYLQGDLTTDTVFGDGVRCASGTLLRLRTKINAGGASSFPDTTDTLSLSQRGGVVPQSGVTRYYQTYYRNSAAAFCPPETFNVTNGFRILW